MKLFEKFADQGFHTTIITTFSVDFDAYENIVLPRLRGAGSYNNILLIDSGMMAEAFMDVSSLPKYAGRQYSAVRVSATGVFHPKIVFQVGRDRGRLLIGSANVTVSGLAGNLEVVGSVEVSSTDGDARKILRDCWSYLDVCLQGADRSVEKQVQWMLARAPWLSEHIDDSGMQTLLDGSAAEFLATDNEAGLLERFVGRVAGEAISRLIVISPYWDKNLRALKLLIEALQPEDTALIIDPKRGLFPVEAASTMPQLSIHSVNEIAGQRFAHAKLVIATTKNKDHVLFGSANCSFAALGDLNTSGLNEEACLYRQTLPGELLGDLGIEAVLSHAHRLELSEIQPLAEEESAEPAADGVVPGSFSLQYSTLVWRPGNSQALSNIQEVQLVDASGEVVYAVGLEKGSEVGEERHFFVQNLSSPPVFAHLTLRDGSLSLPAVINVAAVLLSECRERGSKQSRRSIDRLIGDEEEGLWLLEILDGFDDITSPKEPSLTAAVSASKREESPQASHKVLPYADFIAHSRQCPEGHGVGRNSLAGTEFNYVREYLNRALALTRDQLEMEDQDEGATLALINAAEPEEIDEFEGDRHTTMSGQDDGLSRQRAPLEARVRERQNKEALNRAVIEFINRLREKRDTLDVSSLDVLRLRVLITILLAAGRADDESHTSLQVLPKTTSDIGWPLLIGKALFGMFGGTRPPIAELRLDEEYQHLPDDILESWACCCWAVHACAESAEPDSAPRFHRIAERLYAQLNLTNDQLLSDGITEVMDRMGEQFSGRLAVDSQRIRAEHLRFASLSELVA